MLHTFGSNHSISALISQMGSASALPFSFHAALKCTRFVTLPLSFWIGHYLSFLLPLHVHAIQPLVSASLAVLNLRTCWRRCCFCLTTSHPKQPPLFVSFLLFTTWPRVTFGLLVINLLFFSSPPFPPFFFFFFSFFFSFLFVPFCLFYFFLHLLKNYVTVAGMQKLEAHLFPFFLVELKGPVSHH